MKYDAGNYDVAVIGAGHAGCEAALAAARMGMKRIESTIGRYFFILPAIAPAKYSTMHNAMHTA